jgi:ketopantoate reductase
LDEFLERLNEFLNLGFRPEIADRFQDAVSSKMVVNLTNSLFTLVGYGFREIDQPRLLKKLAAGMLLEGISIVQAQGFCEYTAGGSPSWNLLRLMAKLPEAVSDLVFKQSLKALALNTMAQDVLQHGNKTTELDSLNGYFVDGARELRMDIPYIETVPELCQDHFDDPDFRPMPEEEIWDLVRKRIQEKEETGP